MGSLSLSQNPYIPAAKASNAVIDTGIDAEYIILENIYDTAGQQNPLRQRDLAQIAGASLGMTNSILKRLVQKGWITVKKLNSRNIQYAVTIEGINEIIRRSYSYFKRTIKNVIYFKDILEDLVYRAGRKKIRAVVLAGTSDLDFIVEHACRRFGLKFLRVSGDENPRKILFSETLIIFAENIPEVTVSSLPEGQGNRGAEIFYLSRLITRLKI